VEGGQHCELAIRAIHAGSAAIHLQTAISIPPGKENAIRAGTPSRGNWLQISRNTLTFIVVFACFCLRFLFDGTLIDS
jgi:hypothetical protein